MQPQAMYPPSSVAAAAQPGHSRIDRPGASPTYSSASSAPQGKPKSSAGTMRRARIVITVKRTDAYKKWLEDNPANPGAQVFSEDNPLNQTLSNQITWTNNSVTEQQNVSQDFFNDDI